MAGRVHAPQLKEEKKLKREQSLTTQRIESFIFAIRGQRIIIDRDLAQIYGVKTSRLNEQVKRNKERFPEDFVFQLDCFNFPGPHVYPAVLEFPGSFRKPGFKHFT